MGATISKLAVKLQADTAQFDRGLNKSSRSVNKLGKSAGGISPAMIGIGTAVAAAAAGLIALTKSISSVNEAFERMDKAAKKAKSIGIGAQELQGFQHAASLAGVEGDQMTKALQKMQKGIGEAAMGLGQARVAFEELGISQAELSQMSPDEQFLRISGAIAKIEDPAKRAAMATQIFGRAGADLLPLINQGSEAIASQVAEMERLQGPMSDIDFTNIEDANDAATRFGLTVEGVWNQLAAAIAPAKEIVFDTLTEAGSSLANFIAQNKDTITAFFVSLADKIKIAIEAVSRLVKTLFNIGSSIANTFGLVPELEEQEEIQQRINELEEQANETNEKHLETTKKINKEKETMQKRADKLVEGLKTQAEKYQEQLAEIKKLQEEGMLTEGQATELTARINAKIQSDVDKVVQEQAKVAEAAAKEREQAMKSWSDAAKDAAKDATTNLVRAGSKEMFEQIAERQFKKDNPLANFQKKSNRIATDQLKQLKNVNENLSQLNTVVSNNSGGSNGNGGAMGGIVEVGLGA